MAWARGPRRGCLSTQRQALTFFVGQVQRPK